MTCRGFIWLSLLIGSVAQAGRIEQRAGKTIIHVEVFALPDPANATPANLAEVAVVNAFRAEFPTFFAARYRERYRADPQRYGAHNWDNVEIALERFTGIQVEGVENDLLAIAGGMAPDILFVNFRKSDNYIRSGFLYPLDKPEDHYLTALNPEEVAFRVHPKIWPVIQRKGPLGAKHVWALPAGGALGRVLLYRKDLFDAAGIPYPNEDWTWDDLLAAAKRLTNPAHGTYGMMLGRGVQESWYWISYLWSAGGEVMEYDEATDAWRCTFNGPGAAAALDFYSRLCAERWVDESGKVRRGYAYKDSADALTKWNRGEIAMMQGYVDEKLFSTIDPELTGMAPVPLGPTGVRGAELNARMMGLFAGIKEPAVRDAAWEYLRYYNSPGAEQLRTRHMVEGGLGRFVNPKYLRLFGYPEIARLSPPGWERTFEIAVSTGKPEPYGRNSNLAYNLMTGPIHAAENLLLRDELPADPAARQAVLQDLLDQAAARANAEMIGLIPPHERRLRRIVASVVLVAIVVGFAFVFRKVAQTFQSPDPAATARGRWQFRRYKWAYVLLAPAVLTIFVWHYVPLIRGSVMAVQDYQLLLPSRWVGVDNFGDVLFDSFWWQSVWNACRYSCFVMALTFLPPIALAILLQEVPRGKILFRTIYYLPAVITGVVTAVLWKLFYEPSERGALNAVLLRVPALGFVVVGLILLAVAVAFARRLWLQQLTAAGWSFAAAGVLLCGACFQLAWPILSPAGGTFAWARLFHYPPEPYRWLSDPHSAMVSCVIPMVWAGMGPGCLIYLAALRGIPDDYYEAAELDGANFMDQILFVVLPTIKSLVVINFVGAFIGSWYGATGHILVMTGGGANTEVAGLYIWYRAFTFLQFGPATAMAWFLGFMLIGFTVHQLRLLARVEFKTVGDKK